MWRGGREAPAGGDLIYKDDSLRLLSYATWPNPNVSKESLALAGFYYVGAVRGEGGDVVRCAWCGVELDNWLIGDCPIGEHLRHFPACEHAKEMASRNNISISQDCNDLLLRSDAGELGIDSRRPPVQPKYATYGSRLETYGRWPADHCQNPTDLAAAGFYFSGPDDQVRCYQCDIGLCRWEPTDSPWIEHAKHFPDCTFLLLMKGRTFIEQCRSLQNGVTGNDESTGALRSPRQITEADVENYMDSEDVQVALHCGLQPERIRGAIRRRLHQTGLPFRSSTQLIDAALNEQVNETSFSIPDFRPSQNSASSSSARYPIDDAAIDQVTRMIINSALMEENAPASSIMSLSNTEESEQQATANNEPDDAVSHEAGPPEDDKSSPSHKIRELLSEEAKLNAFPKSVSLEEENKILRDARTCKICMDSEVGVVFLPCGHLVSCIVCASGLMQCPICRGGIKGVVRTYLS